MSAASAKSADSDVMNRVIEIEAKFDQALHCIGVDRMGRAFGLLREIDQWFDAAGRCDSVTRDDLQTILHNASPAVVAGLIRLVGNASKSTGTELVRQKGLFE